MHGKSFNLLDNKEWPYTLVRTLISISELHLPPFLFPLPALSLLGSKKFPIAFFLNLKQHSFKSINNVTLWWIHGWIDHKENIKCLVSHNVWFPPFLIVAIVTITPLCSSMIIQVRSFTKRTRWFKVLWREELSRLFHIPVSLSSISLSLFLFLTTYDHD